MRRARIVAALAVIGLMLAACGLGAGQTPKPPTVDMDSGVVRVSAGTVRGQLAPDHRLFAGIPYAAAPVGPLRWRPPEPARPWPGMLDASKPGPRCVQDTVSDPDFGREVSEDCLNLSVWTPRSPATEPRAVMVWIHGGAFVNGSSDIYEARRLAAQGGIVVVTINYRLGALGFLAHPALGPPGQVGNYGLADQQAALRWVRDNIAAFGGDPARVTVAGESAGGMSVCDHLVAPGSAGLFHAAIIMSGPCRAQANLTTAQRVSEQYATSLGCTDPATVAKCLRALPVSKLGKVPWYVHMGSDALTGPVTGTDLLPEDPAAALAGGRDVGMPMLIGSNTDEFTLFVALQYLRNGKMLTANGYPKLLAETFGADAAAVESHYPLKHFGDNVFVAYSSTVTDSAFACVADRMADGLVRHSPVYAYEFNDRDAPAPEPLRSVPFPVGASHSLELRYLFDVGAAPPMDPAQQRLSDQMVAYWAQFVTNGNPKADGQPDWPQFAADAHGPHMSLQSDGSHPVATFDDAHQCSFWATVKGTP